MDKLTIEDFSRQPIVRGTSCFTDPAGNTRIATDEIQASALVRIAAALERQTDVVEATSAGFTTGQLDTGANHFHAVQVKGSRVVQMQALGTSPEMATRLIEHIKMLYQATLQLEQNWEGVPNIMTYIAKLQADNEQLRAQVRDKGVGGDKWISVSTELPAVNKWVLIMANPNWEPVPIIVAGLAPDGNWVDYDGGKVETPLFWQPLPAPGPRPAVEEGGPDNG